MLLNAQSDQREKKMKEIKFRDVQKNKRTGVITFNYYSLEELFSEDSWQGKLPYSVEITEQYIGLKDRNEKEYFIGDKGRFENGDTFILKMEDWLEVYCDWIGDPECEDQVRDLYRIGHAEIIGNIHEGEKDEDRN